MTFCASSHAAVASNQRVVITGGPSATHYITLAAVITVIAPRISTARRTIVTRNTRRTAPHRNKPV